MLFCICMLVAISILCSHLSPVVGSGNRKNSWWFPAVYQWEEGWVISAEGCRWQNESSWTECGEREREAVDGLLVPSVGRSAGDGFQRCVGSLLWCVYFIPQPVGVLHHLSQPFSAHSHFRHPLSLYFTVTLCYTQHAFCSHDALPLISLRTCSPITFRSLALSPHIHFLASFKIISGTSFAIWAKANKQQ